MVADRREPRLVMLVVNVVRVAVLVATALWVIAAGTTVPVLIAAAVAFGLCDALYQPSAATQSPVPVPSPNSIPTVPLILPVPAPASPAPSSPTSPIPPVVTPPFNPQAPAMPVPPPPPLIVLPPTR